MHTKFLIIASLFAFVLSGCGSSSSSPEAAKGVYQDAGIVSGLQYKTPTQSGVTDSEGKFRYLPGESVVFSVSNIPIGQATGGPIITTFDLAGTAPPQSSLGIPVNNPVYRAFQHAVNISLFLQTLDDDANPVNGIRIPAAVNTIAANDPIDFNAWYLDDYFNAYWNFDDYPPFKVFIGSCRAQGVWGGVKAIKRPGIAANALYVGLGIAPTVYTESKTVHESSISYIGTYTDQFEYHKSGLLTKTSSFDANGDLFYTQTQTYDENGNLTSESYVSRNYGSGRTENTYDQNGNLVSQLSFDGTGSITDRTISTYDINGNKIREEYYDQTGALMSKSLFAYNKNGTLAQTDSYDGNNALLVSAKYTYNDMLLRTTETFKNIVDQAEWMTSYTYDKNLKPVRYDYYRDQIFTGYALVHYDEAGNPLENIGMTAEGTQTYRYVSTFDPYGYRLTLTMYDSDNQPSGINNYIYNSNGSLISSEYTDGTNTSSSKSTFISVPAWGGLIGLRSGGPQ